MPTDSVTTWEAIAAIGTCIEALALVAIFIWDRFDARDQHKQALEQLSAAKDAAAAALLNAQAAIAAERSWVVVIPKVGTIGALSFEVVNKGRTPAKIESVAFNWTFDSYKDSSRVPPNRTANIQVEHTFLVQDAGFVIPIAPHPQAAIDAASMGQRIARGNQFLIYDGKITYRDAFEVGGTEQVTHETMWSYFYDHAHGNLVRIDAFTRYS